MDEQFTDQELAQERQRCAKMAELCKRHGYLDGEAAARAQLRAVLAEQRTRDA